MIINDLSMSFGEQVIFDHVSLSIGDNEKVGIVGVNGAGKSTFFNLICKKIETYQGEITFQKNSRIALLPQIIDEAIPSTNMTVKEFIETARPIKEIEKKLDDLYNKSSETLDDLILRKVLSEISSYQAELEFWDVYNYESILLKIIDGMRISNTLLLEKLCNLSGGQKSKIAFARLLYSKSNIILLDEPTNHLDNESRDFVIEYLRGYKGCILIISHDTSFLDLVITKTLYIDKHTAKMKLYNGNYSQFQMQREALDNANAKQSQIQQREIDRIQAIVDKYATSSGKKKKMAQSKQKVLDKMINNKVEIAPIQRKVNFKITSAHENSKIPAEVVDLCFGYNKNKILIKNLSFSISNGERLLIVGLNGVGKTTLLKLLVGSLKPVYGEVIIGCKTHIGYYAQEHEVLNKDQTIIDNFLDIDINENNLRAMLGKFLFFGDDVLKRISVLSPGERSRIALAKLLLKRPNLLILDEPTNHLDPDTQAIIANAFRTYDGTMVVVSHNPEFVDNIGIERVLTLPSGKISYYERKNIEYFYNKNKLEKY